MAGNPSGWLGCECTALPLPGKQLRCAPYRPDSLSTIHYPSFSLPHAAIKDVKYDAH